MKRILTTLIIIISTIVIGYLIYPKQSNNIRDEPKVNEISEEKIIDEANNIEELTDEILGILEIKKIGLEGPIKEGSTKEILSDYIGHIENTPIFDGNVCLAAHNRGNQYSYFSKLNELNYGDEILYKTRFFEKYYKVDEIKEIDEEDWSMLEDTSENKLTLITCIKNKRSKRLCVQATIDR